MLAGKRFFSCMQGCSFRLNEVKHTHTLNMWYKTDSQLLSLTSLNMYIDSSTLSIIQIPTYVT